MAIWQYTFFVLPKTSLEGIDPKSLYRDEDGFFDDVYFWQYFQADSNFFCDMEAILPYGKSWDTDLLIFGDVEHDCLKVVCQDRLIVSVSLRIDFSKNYNSIVAHLIDYFIQKGMVLVDEDLTPVLLNLTSITQAIKSSKQYKMFFTLGKGLT